MAINRRWQAGAETGDVLEFDSTSGTPTASTVQKKTGSYSFLVNAGTEYGIVNVAGTRQLSIGFWLYEGLNNQVADQSYVVFRDGSANKLVSFELGTTAGIRHLDVNGTNQDSISTGTINEWRHWVLDVYIHSSSGWAKFYRDGVEELSFAGNTGNADIVNVVFGTLTGGSASTIHYYDDIYINDTTGEGAAIPGPILYFYYINPNGNGNYNGNWDGSDGNSTDNYALVDEVPASSTDYVFTATADELESHTMSTFTLGTNQAIIALIPLVETSRTSTTEQIAIGTRYSSTDSVGSDQTPESTYKAMWERQTTKPGGGGWDQTSLDGVEVVYKSRGTY